MATNKPIDSSKKNPSEPKAVNNESLLAKPEKGGTPASDKKKEKSIRNSALLLAYSDEKLRILSTQLRLFTL